jgi:hypothetical protein
VPPVTGRRSHGAPLDRQKGSAPHCAPRPWRGSGGVLSRAAFTALASHTPRFVMQQRGLSAPHFKPYLAVQAARPELERDRRRETLVHPSLARTSYNEV